MAEIANYQCRSADEALARVLKPGQDIVVGQAWGTPSTLLDALPRHRERLAGSRILVGMLVGGFPELPGTRIESFFPSGPLGDDEGLRKHAAVYVRRSLLELTTALRAGRRPVDVLLVQASRPRAGECSLGVTVDFAHAAAEQAGAVVAETGAGVPWTGAGSTVGLDRMLLADAGAAPMRLERTSSSRDAAIAARIAAWIPDGATVQFGMAAWVDPLAGLLRERRGLRIHSGLISGWAATLENAGAVDSAHRITATGAAGTAEFYVWLDGNDRVQLVPADQTHTPEALAALPCLRSVNSVLEVDLSGNVNCEVGRDGRRGGVAGLHDFAVGAGSGADALSIIALSSTARGASRIVPRLPEGAPSLPPGSCDVIVTEHGAADLRGLGPADRARALVSIAAPEHRSALAREAKLEEDGS